MRYLKKFEDLSYKDLVEQVLEIPSKTDRFEYEDINKLLSETGVHFDYLPVLDQNSFVTRNNYKVLKFGMGPYDPTTRNYAMLLFDKFDDYYYVVYSGKCYRCDGIEGLSQFINKSYYL